MAGVAAIAFGCLAGIALLGQLVGPRPQPPAAPVLVTHVLADDTCASAPHDPLVLRLGATRAFAPTVGITLEPAPFSIEPPITAAEAYRRSGRHLSGCDTEELLAYFSSASPSYSRVLAWVLVSSLACPIDQSGATGAARQCLTVIPVNASTGTPMGTRAFNVP